jgi:chemotaxis protein CheD
MGPNSFLDFAEKWTVGIGELSVTNDLGVMLATYSLGSCLGVTAYDPVAKAGGLLRAVLPQAALVPDKAHERPALFVDTGLPALLRALAPYGVEHARLHVCLAGGAQCMDPGGIFDLGQRNVAMARRVLEEAGVRLRAMRVGGPVSRSLFLDLATGAVRLRVPGQPEETTLCPGWTNS